MCFHSISAAVTRRRQAEMVGAIDIGGTKTIVALVQEDGTIAVSYTHLDVYKRQALHRAPFGFLPVTGW